MLAAGVQWQEGQCRIPRCASQEVQADPLTALAILNQQGIEIIWLEAEILGGFLNINPHKLTPMTPR